MSGNPKKVILKAALIVAIMIVLLKCVLAVRICHSADMAPNLKDGDLVISLRTPFAAPRIGEAVLYRYGGKEYFGRIAAAEGDEVFIDENGLRINGLYETAVLPYQTLPDENTVYPVTVPSDSFFVIGDMRETSFDSRVCGTVKYDDLIGRAVFVCRYRNI